MAEPSITDELTQGVKDAQAEFDAGMGADGDASPYPMLKELRAKAPVHPGWPEMGVFENPEEGQQIFSTYTFDAVKAVFTDNKTFSTKCYEAIVRPLQGPTILEMQEPEHQVYRRLHEFAFARSSMQRWEAELVRPLVERTVERLRDAKRADLVEEVFMPIPVRVIAALIGLPESDVPEFHRLGIQLLGFQADMDTALKASAQLREYFVGILADRRREPRDDMVTVLAEADIDGVRMSDEQIYGFMRNLLPAGAETTSRSTANLAFGLLTHPDQLAAVVADRSLLPQAIEEDNSRRRVPRSRDTRGLDGVGQSGKRQPRRGQVGRPRTFRHIPGTQAAHRVRARRPCVHRYAPRPAREHPVFQHPVRPTPGTPSRPRCSVAVHRRHAFPVPATPQSGVGLSVIQ
jgi:cytochrome P450